RGGLYRYRKTTQEIDGFTNEQGFPKGDIKKLLLDHEENLWVLTYRSGLLKFSSGLFVTYDKNEGLEGNLATTALQVEENEYWIGIESGEIQKIKDGRILANWNTKTKLPNQRLKYLMQDSKGYMWASTYGGLLKLDKNGKRIKVPNEGLLGSRIRYTKEDSKGNILVATARKGLFKINEKEEITTFDSRNGLVSNFILSIDEAENGDIWIGTNNGISIIRDDAVVKSIQIQDGIPTNMTFDLYLDGEIAWVASEKGLYRMEGKESYLYEFEGNKGDNAVFDIIEDENSNLWFTSTKGVFVVSKKELNLKASNPRHIIKSRLLAKADGMKNQQSIGATKLMMDSHGSIWIPTIAGMAVVNSKNITFKKKLFPPIITKIISSDSAFYTNETSTMASEIPAGGGKRLEIHFSSFDFTAPEKNTFKYRLMPFEYEWLIAEKENVVRYTNLPGQSYSFQIQKGDNSGNWSEIESFNFLVKSRFTETIWFYALIILASILTVWILYKSRLRVIKVNEENLQERVNARTAEVLVQKEQIEAQNKELENTLDDLKEAQIQLIHSEKMASLGQLTAGIAHEINNPINFISGGVEALTMILDDLFKVMETYSGFEDADEVQLEKIKQDVREIKIEVEYDDLVVDIGQMLKDIKYGTHRTAEIVVGLRNFSHSNETKKAPANLHECIETTLTILRNQYKDKIEIIRDFDDKLPIVNCTIGQINQVFMNIIANSIQAIDGKGEIRISTKKLENDKVAIIISDSGKGMTEEVRNKVFDPFFTTKDIGKGTGLGLSISHGIIKDHEGEISVTSELGKQTTFRIELPIGKPNSGFDN
ncbi:MAG: signal transduction histidine kinase, partial [Arenicella sp.]